MEPTKNVGEMGNALVAGTDYPRTYREFVEKFPNEATCVAFLVQLRWPKGFVCPACHEQKTPWIHTRNRLVCPSCRNQTTATAGTVFDKTRTHLTTWFEAAWHLTTAKNGMSATTLQRTLGVRYRVAWMMLQRYRVAMVRADRPLLCGNVEVDETLVGGVEHGGKRGRGTAKSVVVIAVEAGKQKGLGRVRMKRIPDASGENLVPFIRGAVQAGSTVLTDGWKGYNDLARNQYRHEQIVLSNSGDPAHVAMPGVHRIASLLKRWILGTHQGAVDGAHIQSYLEEFTFRFNRRHSKHRGLVFRRLIEQAVATAPVIEAEIAHGYKWPQKSHRRS
jgi:transposase-like protein